MLKKCKIVAVFVVSILLLIITSCKTKKDDKKGIAKKAPPIPKADAYIVKPEILSENIEISGSLMPYEETEIHPEVSGRVTAIYFNEGSNIGQGSVLVKLYDGDLQAQLNKLQIQLKTARETLARYGALLKINGVSQQEYDLNQLAVNNIIADINIIQTSISKTLLRAPFSGKLGLRNISIGAYVNPQTIITTLRKVSQLKLEFTVPEKYSTSMTTGSLVNFMTDNNEKVHSAKIIATENNISEDTRNLKVRALVDKADPQLIAGSFVKVKISLGRNNTALMIPTQAVIPQARNKKVMVFRNGIASMEVVTTGTRNSSKIEIVTGLKSGDTILITGLLTTKPGVKVQLGNIIND